MIGSRVNEYCSDVALLFLRVTIGLMMAFGHGLGKLQYLMSGAEIKFPDPIGLGASTSLFLAGSAEFVASLLLAVGLFARISLIPLIFTMAVAVLAVHGSGPFKEMELALMYLIPYVTLFITGPGKISVDHVIKKKFCKSCCH